jgi:hypothetical protein
VSRGGSAAEAVAEPHPTPPSTKAITSDHIVLNAARADIRVATDVGVENHLIADGNGG